MVDDLNEIQKREYDRWQGYANALLIALTILFSGTALAFPAFLLSVIPIIFALVGIFCAVMWFTFEWNKKIRGKPALLWLASCCFGASVGTLLVLLIISLINPTFGTSL